MEKLGSGANGQERILKMPLVLKGVFIEARGQDLWAERAAWDCEKQLIIHFGVGGGKDKGKLTKVFYMLKKTHWILEAWLFCQANVFPSSKAVT